MEKSHRKHMKQRPPGEERRNSGSDQCLDETGFESGELHCGSSCGLIFPIAKAWSSGSGLGRDVIDPRWGGGMS